MRKFSFAVSVLTAALLLALVPRSAMASASISALAASADMAAGTVTVTGRVSSGSTGNISIQVMDTSGNKLYSGNASSAADGNFTLTCSLGELAAANYLVKATADSGDMPAVVFLIAGEAAAASQDETGDDPGGLTPVVVPLLAPPTVAISAPASNAKSTTGTAIAISASGTGCDHMAACYKEANGQETWLGVQNGNSYSAFFTPQLSGTYIITVCGRNTAKDTDPGSLNASASRTIVAELPTPTVRLLSPPETYGATVRPGTITISAVGTGCDNMEAVIMKNNKSTSLGVQRGNIYTATFKETGKADILVTVYGRNSSKSTDPGYKQVQKSAYIYVRPQ